jgi:hypothetical protein
MAAPKAVLLAMESALDYLFSWRGDGVCVDRWGRCPMTLMRYPPNLEKCFLTFSRKRVRDWALHRPIE